MSGTAASSVVVGIGGGGELGYGGYRPPFTAVQWQELEHQAMIYKYLVAGLPVPPDLVLPIRRSFDALSARFFHHPSCNHLPKLISEYLRLGKNVIYVYILGWKQSCYNQVNVL